MSDEIIKVSLMDYANKTKSWFNFMKPNTWQDIKNYEWEDETIEGNTVLKVAKA